MNKKNCCKKDFARYDDYPPKYEKRFLFLFRKCQCSKGIFKLFWKWLYFKHCKKRFLEIPINVSIGSGLYLGHAYSITINPNSKIGKNCNIHKNVTIGQENRGTREGSPTIGNCVFLGINCIVVGKISVGNNVLIAPGAFVNFDVPSDSIVVGNPGRIIHKKGAVNGYIQNPIE